jgi:GT2 family glycosyltransferase
VTGACLMTRRELFERVGGLSTELPVNYNDIDYCLKVHSLGHTIVYDPDLVMYHFESSTREPDVEEWEKEKLTERWGPMVAADPYSNPNLSHGYPRISSAFAWARRRLPRPVRRLARAAVGG